MWVTRRVKITRRVWVWNHFLTRMRVRVTRRVKFNPNGYGYGWPLPDGYIPVAIPSCGSTVKGSTVQTVIRTSGFLSPCVRAIENLTFHLMPLDNFCLVQEIFWICVI